jgi:hypothetical protein
VPFFAHFAKSGIPQPHPSGDSASATTGEGTTSVAPELEPSPACLSSHFCLRNSATRRATAASSDSSHSQRTKTPQPPSLSFLRFVPSRRLLCFSFGPQYSLRESGACDRPQPECECQKQPCTKTILCNFGKTISGRPGSRWLFSLYLDAKPTWRTICRTMISGEVSLQRMRCMFRLRCSRETLSKDGCNLDFFYFLLGFLALSTAFWIVVDMSPIEGRFRVELNASLKFSTAVVNRP